MHTSNWLLPLKSKYSWGWEECHKYCRYLVMNQRTFGLMMPLHERGLPKLWRGWHECLYKTLWKSIQYSRITIYTVHAILPWPHLSVTATGKNSITFCIHIAIVQMQLQHVDVMWMLDTFEHIVWRHVLSNQVKAPVVTQGQRNNLLENVFSARQQCMSHSCWLSMPKFHLDDRMLIWI